MSDLLTCPACGPSYGLILMPERVEERRVAEGVLGCAECRRRYGIRDGVADLRLAEDGAEARGAGVGSEGGGGPAEEAEGAVRVGGLLGLAGVTGVVVLAGSTPALGTALSGLVEGVEVAVVGDAVTGGTGITRVRAGGVLPFRTGSVAAVWLTGVWSEAVVEGWRVVRRAGRVVVEGAVPSSRSVAPPGLRAVASEGGVVVYERVS